MHSPIHFINAHYPHHINYLQSNDRRTLVNFFVSNLNISFLFLLLFPYSIRGAFFWVNWQKLERQFVGGFKIIYLVWRVYFVSRQYVYR